MIHKLVVPPFGELEEIKVLAWQRKEGATVEKGDLLVELEMDKAIIEVTADERSVLRKILCPAGEWHKLGTPLAVLSTEPGEAIPEALEALKDLPAKFEPV